MKDLVRDEEILFVLGLFELVFIAVNKRLVSEQVQESLILNRKC